MYFVLCTFGCKSTKYKVQFPREKCGVGGEGGLNPATSAALCALCNNGCGDCWAALCNNGCGGRWTTALCNRGWRGLLGSSPVQQRLRGPLDSSPVQQWLRGLLGSPVQQRLRGRPEGGETESSFSCPPALCHPHLLSRLPHARVFKFQVSRYTLYTLAWHQS